MDYWIKIIFLIEFVICLQASKIPDCLNSEDPEACYKSQDTTQEILKKIDRLNDLQVKNEQIFESLRQRNNQLTNELDDLKQENQDLLSTMKGMEDEMKNVKVETSFCKNTTEDLKEQNEDISDTVNNLRSLQRDLITEFEEAKEENKNIILKAKSMYEKNIELLQPFQSFKAEIDELISTRVEHLEANHADFQSNLAETREENKNISNIVSVLNEKNTELSNSLAAMKSYSNQLESDLTAKHNEILGSATDLRNSMNELETLKKQHMEQIRKLSTGLQQTHPCGIDGSRWKHDRNSGNCYLMVRDKLTWEEARDKCRSLAGTGETSDLASVHSYEENNFIIDLLDDDVWIGLSDIESEGMFRKWSDGSAVMFTDWDVNEPNQMGQLGDEDCVEIRTHSDYKWNDRGCNRRKSSVCKKTRV